MNPVYKGLIVSGVPALLGGLLLGALDEGTPVVVGFGALCLLTGALLGFQGGRARRSRRSQLLAWGLAAYCLCSFLSGCLLMILVDEASRSLPELLGSALIFAMAGAIMYSPVILPVVLVVAFVVEGWTRNDARILTP